MINLIKNRPLMIFLGVLCVAFTLNVGQLLAATVGIKTNTFSRSLSSNVQSSGGEVRKIYTASQRFAQSAAASALTGYDDSVNTSYIVPSTSLVDVDAYSIKVWVSTTTGDSALVAGDSVEFILDVSPDGTKWVTPSGAHPSTFSGTASAGVGTNMVVFGPFNRTETVDIDSTANLFDNYGINMAKSANYFRVRSNVRGQFDGTPDTCTYNYKAVVDLLK